MMKQRKLRLDDGLIDAIGTYRERYTEYTGEPLTESAAIRMLIRKGIKATERPNRDRQGTPNGPQVDPQWTDSTQGGSTQFEGLEEASAPVRAEVDSPINQSIRKNDRSFALSDLPLASPAAIALAGEVVAALKDISDVQGFVAGNSYSRALLRRWCEKYPCRDTWMAGIETLRRLDCGYLKWLKVLSIRGCIGLVNKLATHPHQPVLMPKLYALGQGDVYDPCGEPVALASILRGSAYPKDWTVCPVAVQVCGATLPANAKRYCELMKARSPGVVEDITAEVRALFMEHHGKPGLRAHLLDKSGPAAKYKGLIRPIIEAALGPQRIRSEAV